MYRTLLLALLGGLIAISNVSAETLIEVRVIGDKLNVRQTASTSSKVLAKLPRGTVVQAFTLDDAAWLQIVQDKKIAYISSEYVELERILMVDKLAAEATANDEQQCSSDQRKLGLRIQGADFSCTKTPGTEAIQNCLVKYRVNLYSSCKEPLLVDVACVANFSYAIVPVTQDAKDAALGSDRINMVNGSAIAVIPVNWKPYSETGKISKANLDDASCQIIKVTQQ